MAIPLIKATYSLDAETVRALESMARRLGTSKSEAVRRAILSWNERGGRDRRLAALDDLQRLMELGADQADAWERDVLAERHALDRERGDATNMPSSPAKSKRDAGARGPAKRR